MKSIAFGVLLSAVVIGVGMLALTRTADAAHVLSVTSVSGQPEVGRPVELQVSLRSVEEAAPVPSAVVMAYTDASFGGVTGEVEVGRALTDENGIAVLTYEPRSAGDQLVRIEYLPPGANEPEAATTTISVASASQLHRSTAGIQVPGLNVWLIIALVALVWSILFSVGLRVFVIARASTAAEPTLEWAARSRAVETQAVAPEAGGSGA